ncbi:LRP16 family protein [Talaromyces proteolyticus]|uniref:LRP16 family protein n=1 Tax=Talaromyces proteolyticus TaxID=1131652 RepID=A0AAD4KSG2_9EURO|nr:LRP16 family protein [Talaromyces proteolyticus]KAH8695000.1 LRP16 family protein [Talaromyces proteolyticus]
MASVLKLSEIPTLTRLYRSGVLRSSRQPVVTTPSKVINDIISHIKHDITELEVGCIVNAANRSLLGGGGVDGAIHSAAGPQLYEECLTLDGCETGHAKITNGYELPAEKIIHAVGPIYVRAKHDEAEQQLRGCYRRSLELAVQHGQRSIAFSAISTGVYGYPNTEAATAAIDEVRKFLNSGDNLSKFDRVIFCSFMTVDLLAYERILPAYFPPVTEELDATEENQGNQTQDDTVIVDKSESEVDLGFDTGDEHDWEEISEADNGHEDFQEELVQIGQADQEASVADVRSMQSSTADFDDLTGPAEANGQK